MAIIRHLFHLFRDGDDFTKELFVNWATGAERGVGSA